MKYRTISTDDLDSIMVELKQAESIAYVMSCNTDLEEYEANIFWAIKDLIESARGELNKASTHLKAA